LLRRTHRRGAEVAEIVNLFSNRETAIGEKIPYKQDLGSRNIIKNRIQYPSAGADRSQYSEVSRGKNRTFNFFIIAYLDLLLMEVIMSRTYTIKYMYAEL
jgi:hypothetical protein